MNVDLVKEYLRARDAFAAGNSYEALAAVAHALGADEPTPMIHENLEKFMDPDTPSGEALLRLLVRESNRRPG